MGADWERLEVEATVSEYFNMLDKELRGLEYNKTKHRRCLARLLKNRSNGAIERKHQNISAVLIELGFPYISGYKPLRNYQQLLYEVVEHKLENNPSLIEIVRLQVSQPANIPSVDDILSSLVEPPFPQRKERTNMDAESRKPPIKSTRDFLVREARNRSLGDAGERFVIEFEKERLIREGSERLASKVEHVAATQGDSTGFDILSFDISGRERFIEVKTTSYGSLIPFYVTRNEVAVSRKSSPNYYLYRLFLFRRDPKFFVKKGSLDESFNIVPTQYMASVY